MKTQLSRRAALGGLLSLSATAALANAPLTSMPPLARAPEVPERPRLRPNLDQYIFEAGLTGLTGVIVTDTATGEILEQYQPLTGMAPASVAKVVTSLYAMETLGADYRFTTQLIATGPISDEGVLDGDLVLVGGGDPTLTTDNLGELAQMLVDAGVKEVTGAFQVWGGALPYVEEIEPEQLDHLGYNPAVSGLNLNFNRVFFEWARTGSSYDVTMDARSEKYSPSVEVARMEVIDRSTPIYTYENDDDHDDWTVSKAALGEGGGYWLPVRHPDLYAGDVFHSIARSKGIKLSEPVKAEAAPTDEPFLQYLSEPLHVVVKDCLKYSTNLTAEVLGLTATAQRTGIPADLKSSAAEMRQWILERTGATVRLMDHCGLNPDSRITPASLVGLLNAPDVQDLLRPLLKNIVLRDAEGTPINTAAHVEAKTGTLNFVSALAGYVHTKDGRELSFAIFSGDLPRREAFAETEAGRPQGAASYNGKAKRLQQVLLQRWADF